MNLAKLRQTMHLEKWDTHITMIRLVRDLEVRLEEAGLLTSDEHDEINNVIYGFLNELPKKVYDEVREG